MNHQTITGYEFVSWSTLATAEAAIESYRNRRMKKLQVVDESEFIAVTPEHPPYRLVQWEIHRKVTE